MQNRRASEREILPSVFNSPVKIIPTELEMTHFLSMKKIGKFSLHFPNSLSPRGGLLPLDLCFKANKKRKEIQRNICLNKIPRGVDFFFFFPQEKSNNYAGAVTVLQASLGERTFQSNDKS